jgi:hypothetical protein
MTVWNIIRVYNCKSIEIKIWLSCRWNCSKGAIITIAVHLEVIDWHTIYRLFYLLHFHEWKGEFFRCFRYDTELWSTEKADIQPPDDINIIDIVNVVLVSWTLYLFYDVNSFCGPKSSVLVGFYFWMGMQIQQPLQPFQIRFKRNDRNYTKTYQTCLQSYAPTRR